MEGFAFCCLELDERSSASAWVCWSELETWTSGGFHQVSSPPRLSDTSQAGARRWGRRCGGPRPPPTTATSKRLGRLTSPPNASPRPQIPPHSSIIRANHIRPTYGHCWLGVHRTCTCTSVSVLENPKRYRNHVFLRLLILVLLAKWGKFGCLRSGLGSVGLRVGGQIGWFLVMKVLTEIEVRGVCVWAFPCPSVCL